MRDAIGDQGVSPGAGRYPSAGALFAAGEGGVASHARPPATARSESFVEACPSPQQPASAALPAPRGMVRGGVRPAPAVRRHQGEHIPLVNRSSGPRTHGMGDGGVRR